jgi:hypothetical protein
MVVMATEKKKIRISGLQDTVSEGDNATYWIVHIVEFSRQHISTLKEIVKSIQKIQIYLE